MGFLKNFTSLLFMPIMLTCIVLAGSLAAMFFAAVLTADETETVKVDGWLSPGESLCVDGDGNWDHSCSENSSRQNDGVYSGYISGEWEVQRSITRTYDSDFSQGWAMAVGFTLASMLLTVLMFSAFRKSRYGFYHDNKNI